MYPRIEDAGHYSPFHTIPFSVGGAEVHTLLLHLFPLEGNARP